MANDANKELVRAFWEAFAGGDADKAFAMMSDDFVWVLQGTTPLSGTYRGKAEVREKFLAKAFEVIDAEAGIGLELQEVIAEGDRVVARLQGAMTGRHGPYNNAYCHVMSVRDGKLSGTIEYVDTALVNAALYGA